MGTELIVMKSVVRCTACGVSFDPEDIKGIEEHKTLENGIKSLQDALKGVDYEDAEFKELGPQLTELMDQRMLATTKDGDSWSQPLFAQLHREQFRIIDTLGRRYKQVTDTTT